MPTIRRRRLLSAAGAGIAAASLPWPRGLERAFAKEGGPRTLVIIYLRGGADPLNVIVPYGDSKYDALRPTLAIPPEDTPERRGVVVLDKMFGLHPALAPLEPLWTAGRLAPIVNVGSPHPTRSHFDAQDFMEYAAPGVRTVRDGWLNRYLQLTRKAAKTGDAEAKTQLRALAMQGLLPRALRGAYPALAVPDARILADDKILDLFEPLYADEKEEAKKGDGENGEDKSGKMTPRPEEDDPVVATGRDTVRTLKRFREIVGRRDPTAATKYPPGQLGGKLRAIAKVIRAGEGLEVAAIDIGGWDTHANQGGVQGAMPRLLSGLAGSLAAFATDLGPRLDDTLVVTMSEFGRTCRENGNFGTDHGHGGFMLLLGGAVRGGQVHGKWTGLGEQSLYQSRDLQVTTDFRDVFATVLRRHFEVDVPRDFFPDYRPSQMRGLIG